MRNYTRDDDLPKKELNTSESKQPSCGDFSCPYGQPQPTGNKGARTLILIMIGIAAAFVIGFGGYAVFLSIYDSVSGQSSAVQNKSTSQKENTDVVQEDSESNPVGTATNPDFAGLTFYRQSSEQLTAKQVFKAVAPSIAVVGVESGGETYYSSGIVLTEDGYILTAAHAIGYSREDGVSVITEDGEKREAVVVGFDSAWDVAVLKVEAKNLTPAVFAKKSVLSVGDAVYTVTASDDRKYNCVLTQGIVSALNRDLSYDSVSGLGHFQTDAGVGINGSGGALVNESGQIIGMTISSAYLSNLYAGESYALPIEAAETVIEGIIRTGYVPGKVRLGITGTTISKSDADSYGVPQGVMILELQSDSGFVGTGVQLGDIMTKLAGEPVTEMADVAPILQKHKPGEQIEVELYRQDESGEGHSFTVTILLQEDVGQTQK